MPDCGGELQFPAGQIETACESRWPSGARHTYPRAGAWSPTGAALFLAASPLIIWGAPLTAVAVGKFFTKRGYTKVKELDWHDDWVDGDLKITALPAIHFSGRSIFDHNKTLWAGYSISSKENNVFFSGDTGYSDVFKEIGEKYGPFDHALIAIGAYQPARLMHSVHITPEQAIQVAKDIRAKTIVGMHWGTVQLSDDPPFEPPGRFLEAGTQAGYAKDDLWLLKIGETRRLNSKSYNS